MNDDNVEWKSWSDIPQPQIDPEFLRRVIESFKDPPCGCCDGSGKSDVVGLCCPTCGGSGKSGT